MQHLNNELCITNNALMKICKTYILTLILFLFAQVSLAQYQFNSPDSLFSIALTKNLKKYKKESKKAYQNSNFKRGQFLFDSLVSSCLKEKSFDNFKAKKLSGKTVEINSYFEKPTVLITYASWCIIAEGEQNAINDLAKTHKKEIDFVVLFWDNKKNARKASKVFNRNVSVIYIDEKDNTFYQEVKVLKHTFGFPTSFYLDKNNKLSNINRPSNLNTSIQLKLKNYTETYAHLESEIQKIAPEIKTSSNNVIVTSE